MNKEISAVSAIALKARAISSALATDSSLKALSRTTTHLWCASFGTY